MANVKLQYMIFCDNVSETSGKVNMLGIFTTIWTREFPCVHPQFFIAMSVSGIPGAHSFHLEFRDSLDQFILPPTPNLEFACPEFGDANLNVQIDGLRVEREGFVTVEFYVDGEKSGARDLMINKKK